MPHWDRATLPEYTLALAVIGAPLAIGAVHIESQLVLAPLALLAFGLAAWRLHRDGRRVRLGLAGLGLLIALTFTFLQWLPLPAALVAELAPDALSSRLEAAALAGLPAPTWVPLSLDAGRTAGALVSLLAVLGVYLAATSLRGDSNVRSRLTIYVEVAALGVLAAGLLHAALGLDAIWGVYTPVTADFRAIPFGTTFVNPNHAAALMVLGALVAFGASLSAERSQRWHLVVGLALSAGVLATMSRANAALLIIGLFALTIPPLASRHHREMRGRSLRLLIGALACLSVALILIGPERWARELAGIDAPGSGVTGLVEHGWGVASEVALHSPWVGVGAGAFQMAASAFAREIDPGLLAFAHHGPLQVLADLGLVVGGLVLLLVSLGFLRMVPSASRDLPTWGATVALGALAAQNLVDFSLWIPGVGLPAALTLGLVTSATWPKEPRRLLDAAWRWPLTASGILVGVFLVTALPALRDAAEPDKAEMRAALATAPGEPADLAQVAQLDRGALALTHAHDFQVLLLASALAEKSGLPTEAKAWAERALTLAPLAPAPLVTALRLRLVARDEVGAAELLERLDRDRRGDPRALQLLLAAPWAKVAHERFFTDAPLRVIAAVQLLYERGQGPAADELLVWALARSPRSVPLYEELGRRRFNDAAFLTRLASTCLSEAGLAPDAERPAWERLGYLFQGRVEYLENRDLRAWFLYLASADAEPDRAQGALLEAARAAERLGRMDWLDEALNRLASREIVGAWPRGEYHLLRSKQHEVAGDLASAIREMHEVLRHLGHVAAFHDRLADLFFRTNDDEAGENARARARALEAEQKAP